MTRTTAALAVFAPVLILAILLGGVAGLILAAIFAAFVFAVILDDR